MYSMDIIEVLSASCKRDADAVDAIFGEGWNEDFLWEGMELQVLLAGGWELMNRLEYLHPN